jgi:hypothetical protein
MLHLIAYQGRRGPSSQVKFMDLMETDLSAIDGVTFALPSVINTGSMSDLDFILENTPKRFKLKMGFHASSLEPDVTYPFDTVAINGNIVPVLADPKFFDYMIAAMVSVRAVLQGTFDLSRVMAIGLAPTSRFFGDGEFSIDGASNGTQAEALAFWDKLGVNTTTVPPLMADYMKRAGEVFPGAYFTCCVLCPYNSYIGIGGQGDEGRSYSEFETAMQGQVFQGIYVTEDQTLNAPRERELIRKTAGVRPYCYQAATVKASDTDQIIAIEKLGQSYGAIWGELQGYMVAPVTQYLRGQTAALPE